MQQIIHLRYCKSAQQPGWILVEIAGQEKILKKGLKKRENLEKFREYKLSRTGQNKIFLFIDFREDGQNSLNLRKFLLLK